MPMRSMSRRKKSWRSALIEPLEPRTLLSSNYVVNSLADSGAGSLRAQVASANANPGSTISFLSGLTGTITLTTGAINLIALNGTTTITGPGAGTLSISGNNASGVFVISTGVSAAISGLTITHGSTSNGGGIGNFGTLTLAACTITGNTATSYGGGVYNGSAGNATVTGCTISNNNANFAGGIFNSSTLKLTNSTLSGNTATNAAGIYNSATLYILDSTLATNAATAQAGGIYSNNGTLTLINSTLAGNSAPLAGGIYGSGTLTIQDSTIATNQGNGGTGGLDIASGGNATLNNSIVAGNTIVSGSTASDITGTLAGGAFNLIGTGGSGGLTNGTNSNQVGIASPGLGTLQNNGGSTQTISLLNGSPAIDAGSNALLPQVSSATLSTDQRGFTRVYNSTVDIGAFEVQPAPVRLAFSQQPIDAVAGATLATITVNVEGANGDLVSNDASSVTLSLATAPTGATLAGTLTVSAINGVATFSTLSLTTAGSYVLSAADGTLISATSAAFTINAGAAAKLNFTQIPAVATAGAAFGNVTAEVEDTYGNRVTSDTSSVTIAIATGPSGGALGGTFNTTAVAGTATFSALSLSAVGTYTLKATDGTLSPVFSTNIVVNSPLVHEYRLYLAQTAEHLYTTDVNEYNVLATRGWNQEGVAYDLYSGTATLNGVSAQPYYRLYNSSILQHLWTVDANEYVVLATRGWSQEGIIGYLFASAVDNSKPLYRLNLNTATSDLHLWTIDANEYHTLATTYGWTQEGIIGYVLNQTM